ncbi:hypothetical protein ASD38_22375 [Caulobacter sp. Root487D2Y]|uniref:hypothetical protein n=1 Tax=Caulobacter sp. Root487D2Y TaxID=1736547 RepID=UPI0007023B17|nr:hypothetical protein [Caulobacter sp. Root487D2Y]KQY32702.1 hypothetical protein ASD38_22375 [Caulobacter sp. Root487D2Y]
MEYLFGAGLALGAGVFATVVGFDRGRAFYPVVLMVIASYYDLFAVMGGAQALPAETAILAVFVALAVVGFKSNLWLVVAALLGHGMFDLVHPTLVENPGAPAWWPMFCLAYDVAAGGYLAARLLSPSLSRLEARP